MMLLSSPPADRHSPWEDVIGLAVGCVIMALSVQFLRVEGLITGQIAGLSLLGSYVSGASFGTVFFLLNLPFYLLALKQMGLRFTLKSFAAVSAMSAMADALPRFMTLETLHPGIAAAFFGVLGGIGLIVLFRHGATLGGVGIVALWLQDSRGIRAGNVQLGFDLGVFALAALLFDWDVVLWSLLGAVILNLMITVNHRGDRYIARS